jgi:hypothetical protein
MVNNFLDSPINKFVVTLLVLIHDLINFYKAISDPANIHDVEFHKRVAFHEEFNLVALPIL